MVEDLEPPIVPNDVAPRNDTKTAPFATLKVDPLFGSGSAVKYSRKHRTKNPQNIGLEEYWLTSKTMKVEEPPLSLVLDK